MGKRGDREKRAKWGGSKEKETGTVRRGGDKNMFGNKWNKMRKDVYRPERIIYSSFIPFISQYIIFFLLQNHVPEYRFGSWIMGKDPFSSQ